MDEALYACRFVQFTAAMLIFGAAAFRVYAFADSDTRTASSILAGFDAWFWNVALAAALVALISAIALVPCQAAAMAGSPDAAVDFAVLSVVLLETRFGRVWCWHLLLAAILVLACLGRQPRRPVVLFLSLGLLASLGWIGHAAMDNGVAQSDRASACRRAVARRARAFGMGSPAGAATARQFRDFYDPRFFAQFLAYGIRGGRSCCSLRWWWWHRSIASVSRRGFLASPPRSVHWVVPSPSSRVWGSQC
jgi:hypothetical protein